MKKLMMTLMLTMAIAFTAQANTHWDARREARVMTDRMAYELRLTDRQWRAVYDINLRYGHHTPAKEHAMRRVLTPRQFEKYLYMYHSHRAPHPAPGHGHVAPPAHGPHHGHHGPAPRPGRR